VSFEINLKQIESFVLVLSFSTKTIKSNHKKSSSLTFPWWCIFIAYSLSLLLAIVSIFFIIARGIEFGDLKSQKWLTSLISGFFSSILFIQPMKVNYISWFYCI